MRVAVIGLGKIGAALAAYFASKGHQVIGCDINRGTVNLINAGRAPMDEPGLQDLVTEVVMTGRLSATGDTAAAVRQSDVVVVAVPLLVDERKHVDYGAIDGAVQDIARGLQPNTVVIFETTLPVGDVRTRFGPLLAQGSGLMPGRDFWLAFGPERVQSGRILRDLATYPKVVGGIDRASTQAAAAFYHSALDVALIEVSSSEVAEFVKLAQSYYRDVNIALANELAMCAHECNIDVFEAIEVANTDPYSHLHQPGMGVGGHCIPVYPYFFINQFSDTHLLQTARMTNDGMAAHSINLLQEVIGSLAGLRVLILGLAFRANVKEAAFSTAQLVATESVRRGASVQVHDPLFSAQEIAAKGLEPADPLRFESYDAVIIHSYHDQYRTLDFRRFSACRAILDGRNVLPEDVVRTLPCPYIAIGKPPRFPTIRVAAARQVDPVLT